MTQFLRYADQRHERPRVGFVARQDGTIRVGFVTHEQVLVRIEMRVVHRHLVARADSLERRRRQRFLALPGIKFLQVHTVGLIILGLQPERIGLEPQIDVLADHDARLVRRGALDFHRHPQDLVVGRAGRVQGIVGARKGDAQHAAALQRDTVGEMALLPHRVEHP